MSLVDLDGAPVEGPKLPTAAERRAAEARDRRIRKARMLLRDEGYYVANAVSVVETIGEGFYRGYFGAPPPRVKIHIVTGEPLDVQPRAF